LDAVQFTKHVSIHVIDCAVSMLYMLRMAWEVALGMMMNGEATLLAYQISFLPLGLFVSYERHKSVVYVLLTSTKYK